MDQKEIDRLAKIIWDYHRVNHPLAKADCIFVLGSHDMRVATYAADLFLKGYAPFIIFAGGYGNWTKGVFPKPEAEVFVDIAAERGVPRDKMLIENRSANTGENIVFTKALLAECGLDFHSFLLVQKPYMERRAYATFKKVWPKKKCIVTSPPIPFEKYPTAEISKDQMINIMVGDLQRIAVYPAQEFQIRQDIPQDVWEAYEKLAAAGYTKHLIKK